MSKDYYKILGVERGATDDEIKKAYRRLAHQYHPDKSGGSEEKFKEINEAFQVLGNSEKRKKYDQFGAGFDEQGGFGAGVTWEDFMRAARSRGGSDGFSFNFGGVDLGDILGDVFGYGGNGFEFSNNSARKARRGRDIQVDVEIELKDVLNDIYKTVRLRKPSACDVCAGSGAEPGTKLKNCSECAGLGHVERIQRTFLGQIRTQTTCSVCAGSKKVPEKKCKHCKGSGTVQKESDIQVKIPAGIDDGESVRLRGHGEYVSGGEAGDLFLRVHIKKDRRFERDGADLYTDVHINMAQASLGREVPTPALDGQQIKLSIPAGIQSQERIRIKEKGITRLYGHGRGDLYVRVIVDTPKHVSKKAKKLLEELEGEL